ncbi:MAG: 30S ribosomal protein S20 [Actinomycetota bacterium]|nr:30S ribosomal protein S20 [Actinomycetota bacterium]
MPHTKSQEKRLRKSREQRMRNKAIKTSLKTNIKKFYDALTSEDSEVANQAFKEASRALDKAVSKGVIDKNRAADKKSRMARDIRKLPEPDESNQ